MSKWKPAEFEIVTGEGKSTVTGVSNGLFGIHGTRYHFTLTHIPTGMRLNGIFPHGLKWTKTNLKMVVERISHLKWDYDSPDKKPMHLAADVTKILTKIMKELLFMKTLSLILIAIAIAGCGTTGTKQLMNTKVSDQVIIGQTTMDQVRAMYGVPQHEGYMAGNLDLSVWRYVAATSSINAACFVPGLDIAAGKRTTISKVVDIFFDKNGVVTDLKIQSDTKKTVMPFGTLAVVGAAAGAAAAYSNPYGGYNPYSKATIRTYNTGTSSYSVIKWSR